MDYNPDYHAMGKGGRYAIDQAELQPYIDRWNGLVNDKMDGKDIPEEKITAAYEEYEAERKRLHG